MSEIAVGKGCCTVADEYKSDGGFSVRASDNPVQTACLPTAMDLSSGLTDTGASMRAFQRFLPTINALVRRHETKVRFLVTGGFNTALGLALFPILYLALTPFGIHYVIVLIISNLVCVGFAFLTNKFFVFRTSGNYVRELGRFLLFHLSHIGLSLIAVPALVEFAGISPIVAQPFFAAAIVITSYFWHRHITFSRRVEPIGYGAGAELERAPGHSKS